RCGAGAGAVLFEHRAADRPPTPASFRGLRVAASRAVSNRPFPRAERARARPWPESPTAQGGIAYAPGRHGGLRWRPQRREREPCVTTADAGCPTTTWGTPRTSRIERSRRRPRRWIRT